MQGYILNTTLVRDEDLIVTILTEKRVLKLYRFYGARHSQIQIGYKIDFATESSAKSTISRLKDVLHLGVEWLQDNKKRHYFQSYIKLLNQHLRDVDKVEEFYLSHLDKASTKLQKQNPKRVLIEAYLSLLSHEGRLEEGLKCFVCSKMIEDSVVLTRAFLPACTNCVKGESLTRQSVNTLFASKETMLLNEEQTEYLWRVLSLGL